jgi:hypothetical protein
VTAMTRIAFGSHSLDRPASPISALGRQLKDAVTRMLFPPYRPERHYMRGPGPKWREKHGPAVTRRGSLPAKR